jgi:hypothetical protein
MNFARVLAAIALVRKSVCYQAISRADPRHRSATVSTCRTAQDVWRQRLSNQKSEEKAMNPRLIWTLGTGGVLLAGGIGLAMVMAEPTKGPVFIAGDKPVTEDQVRQKLQSDGWSNVQIARDGRYLEATGSKDGQTSKTEVDSQTGRLRADNDDDDDDE